MAGRWEQIKQFLRDLGDFIRQAPGEAENEIRRDIKEIKEKGFQQYYDDEDQNHIDGVKDLLDNDRDKKNNWKDGINKDDEDKEQEKGR